jgi:molybdopterin-guanine dinucleotide biosynthesis protein A
MPHDDADIAARTTLAVLAGGEGSRMGMPKGLLELDRLPILERLHRQMNWVGPTMLVTAPGKEQPPAYELFDIEAVDPVTGQGPLMGIRTALEHATTDLLVVIPIDMPTLIPTLLIQLTSALVRNSEKAMAMFRKHDADRSWIEPLPAAFTVAAGLKLVSEQWSIGHRGVKDLATLEQSLLLEIAGNPANDLWINLNHPADVQRFVAMQDQDLK